LHWGADACIGRSSFQDQKERKKEAEQARANVLCMADFNGTGKTTMGDLVQDPPPKALIQLTTVVLDEASLLGSCTSCAGNPEDQPAHVEIGDEDRVLRC
jgi:hypothetical protein